VASHDGRDGSRRVTADGDPVAAVRREVAALPAIDDRARRSRTAFLAALDHLDRPFDEHADPTHVTASAIVHSDAGVLLHRHKRLGLWLQPGGHIERGETPPQAAVREVAEETGLHATHTTDPPRIVHVDVHPGGLGHIHLDVRYVLRAQAVPPRPSREESQDVAWFTLAAAITIADPGLRGLLLSLRAHGPRST
jgi:8-oxo-dGTP pyrophosphatase MutT (NUDIX family)